MNSDRVSAAVFCLLLSTSVACTESPKSPEKAIESNTLPGLAFFDLASAFTGRQYTIGVGLPESYGKSDNTYPVVYLTDAEGKLHTIIETSRALARTGDLSEVILVGIVNPAKDSRWEDFTPNPVSSPVTEVAAGRPLPKRVGGAAEFHQFVAEELIPRVDDEYRTDGETRVYFGHSLGGLFGLFALQQSRDPFTHYLISSPSIWWNDREIFDTPIPDKEIRYVYLSVGEFEQIPPTLPAEIMQYFPEEIVASNDASRMVEGSLEAYDYLEGFSQLETFANIEEAAPHISADIPAYSRGIRVLLPGTNQDELRRRSSARPPLPW